MKKNQHLISIRGAKGKGGGGSTFEADDNMFARQSAAFIDAIAEGPIKGLVYGDASILVDEVRLRNVNQSTGRVGSTTNFNNFTVITKNGDATQVVDADFFSEYSSASFLSSINGAELLENEPQFHTISSGTFEKRETDYIKITISTTGMSAITKKGDNKGDINTTKVYFTIDFNYVDNSGVHHTKEMFNTGFTGKVSGKYAHTFGFNIEDIKATTTINDWSVKVKKLSASPQSSDATEIQNAIFVDSIEASIADKLEYPYTAYVGGVIDAEAFSSVPARGYEIDGKLIQIPSNHYPLDYNGRKLTLSDASSFAVGDVISQTLSVSSIVAAGTAEEGYTATVTVAAHGVNVGETFNATIATNVTQDEDFYEGLFACTAKSSTTFTYTLNRPFNETTGEYKTLSSTTCGGTKTAAMFSGGLVDKKVSNTLYLRNVAAGNSSVTGTITNQDGDIGSVTSTEQVFIPANYRRNASTEKPTTSEQDWDGTFYQSWCNNPAWVYNDLVTNKIYGLGNYLSQAQVNKWELFQIGRYCDELVPAGVAAADLLSIHCTADSNYIPSGSTGEHEPRFSANLVIAGKQEAYKVLNDVTSIFRGMTYWLNGEAFLVQDSEKDPVYQFTNANVIDGNFSYEGTANKTRTNSIMVNWNNPQDYYRSRTEIVELEEVLQKDDEFLKPEETTAFGCTSRGQARRLGKWKLLTNNWNTNTVSFSTSINAAFLRPGDIVQVLDDKKEGKTWGGRITSLQTGSGTSSIIRIDREPGGFDGSSNAVETGYAVGDYRLTCSFVGYKAILAQDTATISSTSYVRGAHLTSITTEEAAARLQDDNGDLVFVQWTPYTYTETRTLSQVNGEDSLSVSPAFTVKPDADSIWVLSRAALQTGKTKKEAKLFRIMSVAETDRNILEITGLEYNASKFDAIDKNEALTQYRTIYLPDSFQDVPAVTDIDADPVIKASSTGGTVNSLTVTWDPATNEDGSLYASLREYQVEYSKDNEKWLGVGNTPNTSIELIDDEILSGSYYFRVYTINLNGKRSAFTDSGLINIDFNRAVGPAEGSVGTDTHFINFIGNISGGFTLGSTGTVSFSPANYQHNDGKNEHAVTGQGQLDFSGLTGSNSDNNGANTGYVFFDHSANVFKAIAFDEVSGQFYPVGSSVFATATGTLTASTSSSPRKFTGLDSTNFDGELAVGNVFKYTKSSTDYYHRVKRFTSDSELFTFQPTRNTIVDGDNQAFSKPNFLADYKNDTIMGKVVKDGSNAYTLQTFGSSQGEPGYSVFGTNESHTFAASATGTITQSNYTAYTCDFTVKKGSTAYTYAASGTAQNTFGITFVSKVGFANNSDINISGAGQITIDDNSLDSVSSGSATLRITDLSNGETITDRVLSFAKANAGVNGTGSSAVTIKLLANKHVVPYTQAGTESTTITLSTEVQNGSELSGTAYYDFAVDTNNDGSFTDKQNSTTGTFTLADADEPANGDLVIIRVRLRDGATDGTVIATDIVTVYGVKDGTDAYTVINSNNAHTLPTTTAGVVTHTGSGTDIRVFKGSTALTATTGTPSSGQFKVTVTSDTDITVGSASTVTKTSSNDTRRFADHSGMSANTAEIEYAVNCESIQTVTTSQTFSKSQQGATGTAAFSGFLTNENTSAVSYNYISEILVYTGTGGEFKTFTGTTELTSGVTYAVNGTTSQTKNGLTLTINASTGVYTLAGASWSTDSESFDLTATKSGDVLTKTFSINKQVNAAKVEIIVTGHQFAYDTNSANPDPASVTLTANPFGYSLSPQYKWEKSTDAGSSFTTVSDFSSTAAITVSAGAFSIGTELYKVTMRTAATGFSNASVDTDEVTIARIKDGDKGNTGDSGAGVNFVFARSSTKPSTPTANGLNIPSQDIQWYDDPPSGTNILWSSKGTVGVNGTAYAWGPVFQVEGTVVAELKCYSDVQASNGSSPTKPSSSTYNATTSALTLNDSNWNLSPPSVTNNGDTVYSCTVLVTGSPSATSIAIGSGWSTPVIHTRKTDGAQGPAGTKAAVAYYGKTGSARFSTAPSNPGAGNEVTSTSTSNNQWTLATLSHSSTVTVWQSTGSNASGNWVWSTPFLYFDRSVLDDLVVNEFGLDFDSTGFGVLGLTENNYLNSQVTLAGLGGVTSASIPTHTSGAGVPSNSTTPSPNPAGSTYRRTTTPNQLYISNGSTWDLQSINTDTNTTYSASDFNITQLAGYSAAAYANSQISLSGLGYTGATDANNFVLPADVLKGTITVSGQTITIPKFDGSTYNITTQDTNTTYSASDFNITSLAGYSNANYLNSTVTNALVWGSITVTEGATAAQFSSLNNGTSFNNYNTTGELSVTHPTLGTFNATYTWTKGTGTSSGQITGFALTNTGTGNDAWTSSTFGSAAESKSITVTHTASSNTIVMSASVSIINFGSGGGGSGGGGGGGCFLPGTPVDMDNGTLKLISKLEPGDVVQNGNVVQKVESWEVDHWYQLNNLDITGGHPVWIKDKGWCCIEPAEYYEECKALGHSIQLDPQRIEIGDKPSGGKKIKKINKIDNKQTVWSITVNGDHTYHVNGILVHNGAKQ